MRRGGFTTHLAHITIMKGERANEVRCGIIR
jgi:hypothetical protein